MEGMTELPFAVVLEIVELVAAGDDHDARVAFPASHPVTRTLLSLALTSRSVYPVAMKQLYSRCAYIDSKARLKQFSRSVCNNDRVSKHVSSLFLCPFGPDDDLDLDTVWDVATVLHSISKVLRRLVIDMPLRSVYPEDDTQGLRPILRSAFESLEVVEEFCSARDEMYLATIVHPDGDWRPPYEGCVWSTWPKLRRLALYNVDVSHGEFVQGLKERADSLTHLVLTRADGLTDDDLDVKVVFGSWKHCLKRILLVDYVEAGEMVDGMVDGLVDEVMMDSDTVDDMGFRSNIIEVCVRLGLPDSPSEDLIENIKVWVRDRAVSGSLWTVEGRFRR